MGGALPARQPKLCFQAVKAFVVIARNL